MTTTKRNGPRTPPAWRQLSLITDTGDDDHHQPSEDVLPPAHRADPPSSALSLDGLPLMLTVSEAAAVLRVSRTTAYKLAEDWRTSGGRGTKLVPNPISAASGGRGSAVEPAVTLADRNL